MNGLGVSLDGLEPLHDRLRGVLGSYRSALDALRRAAASGLRTSVNTQVGSETMADLPALLDAIVAVGARQWQIQLTVPMGNAADHDDVVLQPYRLLELMPLLARLYLQGIDRDLLIVVGNNIGYFGPFEHLWRGFGDERVHWSGCKAGQTVLALEADGTVKGCPSLPTNEYAGGNVRELTLEQIWRSIRPAGNGLHQSTDELWGFCRTCYYANICGGGCTWMSHSLLGRPGNNPYCHYRALELQQRGVRERILKLEAASPLPFSTGLFAIVAENVTSGELIVTTPPPASVVGPDLPPSPSDAGAATVPPELEICRACNCYIWPAERTCPHCGVDLQHAAEVFGEEVRLRQAAKEEIMRFLAMEDLHVSTKT